MRCQLEMTIRSIMSQTSSSTTTSHHSDNHFQNIRKETQVIIVDAMVYGNMNGNSGCGTVYSRNPETGENILSGKNLRLDWHVWRRQDQN